MKKLFTIVITFFLLQSHAFAANPPQINETQPAHETSLLKPSESKPLTMKEEFKEASEKIGNAFKKMGQKIKSAFRKDSNEREIKNDVIGD